MIKELKLCNFQSHEITKLEFKPGVNVIIGPSDSGKTSIIRALRWLAWNRPLGDAFRSSWGGDTFVVVEIEGTRIVRFKGKEDHYLLTDPKGGELEFKAFGTEVPEEVQQALNFSEINIQNQMDSPFLISDNPGEVSRHFNKIANIDQIDSSLKNVESWVREIRSDIKSTEKEIERYEEDTAHFAYLDQFEAEVEVLEQLEGQVNKQHKNVTELTSLISKIEDVSEDILSKSDLLPAEPLVVQLLEWTRELATTEERRTKLEQLLGKIDGVETGLEEALLITEDEEAVNLLLDLYNKKEQAEDECQQLGKLLGSINEVKKDIKTGQNELEELEEHWHEVAPETCPLCDGTGSLR